MAGAVAVAVATALSVSQPQLHGNELLDVIAARTPAGAVRDKIVQAQSLRDSATAAAELGVGHDTSALDTVPFCLWVAARYRYDFAEACWTAAAAGGDIDTTCAIIGGVLGAQSTTSGIPSDWLSRCEPLPDWTAAYTTQTAP
ncbi:ADP-ribosylglycohydrolase family protein [Nocardia sp. NPDC050710]|uniref:ADP-ribosylglycohydrolase family protein n=1 Tax=Nocardia sp. NPDC050710 TaxID=3157220 RepID=UPI0033D5E1E6